jgi:hypothetical protein
LTNYNSKTYKVDKYVFVKIQKNGEHKVIYTDTNIDSFIKNIKGLKIGDHIVEGIENDCGEKIHVLCLFE